MNDKKKEIISNILGIIFIIWFIGSFIVMIKIGKNDDILCLAVFGQLFFVPGLITLVDAIKAKESFWVEGVITLVGAGVIVGTLIEKYGTEVMEENAEEFIPVIFLSLFVIVGIVFLYMAYRAYFILPKKYNHVVSATCKEVLEDYSDGEHTYCPVFTYTYNGIEYNSCDNVYTFTKYEEGEKYEININPENPEKSFEPRSMRKKFVMNLLMGVGFTASGIYALVMYLTK